MKVTIEKISSKKHTVIRKPFDAEWVKEQLRLKRPLLVSEEHGVVEAWVMSENYGRWYNTRGERLSADLLCYSVTILPPLPRRPTVKDAEDVIRLLCLYRYHGLEVCGKRKYVTADAIEILQWLKAGHPFDGEITHCLYNGERVDVAINGGG